MTSIIRRFRAAVRAFITPDINIKLEAYGDPDEFARYVSKALLHAARSGKIPPQ